MNLNTFKCERTGKEILLHEGFFVADRSTGKWSFECSEDSGKYDEYHIPVRDICNTHGSIDDWIEQLKEKSWFKPEELHKVFNRILNRN